MPDCGYTLQRSSTKCPSSLLPPPRAWLQDTRQSQGSLLKQHVHQWPHSCVRVARCTSGASMMMMLAMMVMLLLLLMMMMLMMMHVWGGPWRRP